MTKSSRACFFVHFWFDPNKLDKDLLNKLTQSCHWKLTFTKNWNDNDEKKCKNGYWIKLRKQG